MSFLLVTQTKKCRFICQSKISESKIKYFVADFREFATKFQMVVTFKELIFRRENWLAEVYNGFDLEVLQIGMKLNSHFAAK